MKKLIMGALLATCIPLYSLELTKTDKAMIVLLCVGTPSITTSAAWYGGVQLGKRIMPIHPATSASEQHARAALINSDPMYPIKAAGAYGVMPAALGIVGFKQGKKWGNKLAALYIAQKYTIPFKEALKITNNYLLENGYAHLITPSEGRIKK